MEHYTLHWGVYHINNGTGVCVGLRDGLRDVVRFLGFVDIKGDVVALLTSWYDSDI